MLFAFVAPVAAAPDLQVGGELARVLISLLGIVALIFAAGWLSRRLQARTSPGGRRLRCVETMAVGARDRLLLIDADGKRLLIGVGQGGMRTLHVYEGSAPGSEAPGANPPPAGFGDLLARWKRSP
jgi:flagellar protein FliO/FliZ